MLINDLFKLTLFEWKSELPDSKIIQFTLNYNSTLDQLYYLLLFYIHEVKEV